MRSFHQPGELGCWNEGDISRPSPSNDDNILVINYLLEHGGQVLAETGVRRFTRHGILWIAARMDR